MAKSASKPSKEEVRAMIKFKKERKKLDILLKKGKINQTTYYRRLQKIAPKGQQIPGMPMQQPPGMAPMQPMPGAPQPGMPMQPQAPAPPQVPVAPSAHEEIPKVGKPLAISQKDIEVVECHACSGLITVTAPQRPVIVECPSCGAKGEVEKIEEEAPAPVPVTATEAEFAGPTFSLEAEQDVEKPEYGPTLDTSGEEPEVVPEPTVESPKVEVEKPEVVEHERKATVEYDESMYESKKPEAIYEHDDGKSSEIMDFGAAKVEGEEPQTPTPKPEVKTPTVSVKSPTPKVSVKKTLKPSVKKED